MNTKAHSMVVVCPECGAIGSYWQEDSNGSSMLLPQHSPSCVACDRGTGNLCRSQTSKVWKLWHVLPQ